MERAMRCPGTQRDSEKKRLKQKIGMIFFFREKLKKNGGKIMSILFIKTENVLATTFRMQARNARFLYMLSTENPKIFKLYFLIEE